MAVLVNVRFAVFGFLACACFCGAQMLPVATKAGDAETVPTIDKNRRFLIANA